MSEDVRSQAAGGLAEEFEELGLIAFLAVRDGELDWYRPDGRSLVGQLADELAVAGHSVSEGDLLDTLAVCGVMLVPVGPSPSDVYLNQVSS